MEEWEDVLRGFICRLLERQAKVSRIAVDERLYTPEGREACADRNAVKEEMIDYVREVLSNGR